MKVEYIKSENLKYGEGDFEEAINEFIKDKKIIDIKYQEYPYKEDGIIYVSANALILYEEKI